MKLEAVTRQEVELLGVIAKAIGDMDQKHDLFLSNGVFARYRGIHRAYVEIAGQAGSLEALKRAVFLQWYAQVEPSCFSGLWELDEDAQLEAFQLLEAVLEHGHGDAELQWMLPHYHDDADWYVERIDGLPEVKRLSRMRPTELPSRIDTSSFRGRGQMGEYWVSIGRAGGITPV